MLNFNIYNSLLPLGKKTHRKWYSDIFTCIHRCARGAAPGRRPRTPPSWRDRPSPARRRPWPRRCCTPRRCPQARGATARHPRRTCWQSSSGASSRRRLRQRRGPRAARRRRVQHGSQRARTTGASSTSCARPLPLSWAPARPPIPSLSCLSFLLYISRFWPVFFSRERERCGGGETSSAPTDRPEERTNANRQ